MLFLSRCTKIFFAFIKISSHFAKCFPPSSVYSNIFSIIPLSASSYLIQSFLCLIESYNFIQANFTLIKPFRFQEKNSNLNRDSSNRSPDHWRFYRLSYPMLLFCPSWSCTIICWFTSLCKYNSSKLNKFLRSEVIQLIQHEHMSYSSSHSRSCSNVPLETINGHELEWELG